jgi:cytochrome c peroxidase
MNNIELPKRLSCLLLFGLLSFAACQTQEQKPATTAEDAAKPAAGYQLKAPLGLELESSSFYVPKDNLLTEAKIKLGKRLYFEKALSLDNTLACASCHVPEKGFADPNQFSLGIGGKKGGRQAPSIINRVFSRAQFWDGRAKSLEEQALGPMMNPVEMGHPDIKSVLARLEKDPSYVADFKQAFPEANGALTDVTLSQAIASFERTVLSGNSPYDRYQAGDKSALNDSAKRGLELFNNKANCAACHSGFNFTDESYHNLGVGMTAKKPDMGRYAITKLDGHQGAFKTPTLREIANTAPYLSDGSLKTLAEVVEFYDKGCQPNKWLSPKIKKLDLTAQEKQDLVEFMKALSGEVVWYRKEDDTKQAATVAGSGRL